MSNEQETVSVSIPAPPKGWRVDGYRHAMHGEIYYEDEKWRVCSFSRTGATYPCAIREQSEAEKPEYEEIPVYTSEHNWQIAGEWLPAHWACRADFAGTIYEHPNGHRKVFGFAHPIFVRPASQAAIWDWSHAETKQHTHMIRPVAIRRKVAK